MEGAFVVNGVIHHVLKSSTYLRLKEDSEPHPSPGEKIVIFRDGLDSDEEEGKGGLACNHDQLDFNSDPSHKVLQNKLRQASPWWAEHSIAGKFDVDVS